MKKTMLRKVAAFVLSLAMVVTGLYIVAPEAEEVQAATAVEGESYKEYSTTAVANYWGKAPTDIPDGKIFAGWYKDAECTELVEVPETEYVAGGKTYAKLVDEEVFALKMQLSADGTKIRLVSSVDSLNYSKVGFEVVFDGGEAIDWWTATVLERVNATNTGVEYNYSPKVVDADSEYFVTGTLTNIASTNTEKDFYIRPYVVTLDGAKSFGLGRMFSVEDGQATEYFNVAVKGDEVAAGTEVDVTVDGASAKADVVGYEEGYAHLNVKKAKTELASNAVVAYGNNTVTYENLQSSADVDTSWYDADKDTYYLATVADLYGFAEMSQTDSFAGKTIILVSDITINEGSASVENGWTPAEGASKRTWSPIGYIEDGSTRMTFQGTFDGNGNAISGLVVEVDGKDAVAFISQLGKTGVVKNLKIANSYIQSKTSTCAWIGTVVGRCQGKVENAYVGEDVVVTAEGYAVGGIAGTMEANAIFSQCWFAGKVRSTAGDSYIGGIVGGMRAEAEQSLVIKDCLSTGYVYGGSWESGGIFGGVGNVSYNTNLTIKNCLNMSTITQKQNYYEGGIAGWIGGSTITVNMQDVYSTTTAKSDAGTEQKADHVPGINIVGASTTINGIAIFVTDETEQVGNKAFENFAFDWWSKDNADGVWVVTETGVPQLKAWSTYKEADIMQKYTGENGPIEHYGWYLAKIYKNGEIDRSSASTFEIETVEDLRGLATVLNTYITIDETNYNENFSGDTVLLMNSLDVNPGWDATTKQAPANVWTPLSDATVNSYAFSGTFDGQGHTIRGIYVNKSANGAGGLFGQVKNSAVIKDFTLENSYIASTLSGSTMGVGAVATKAGDAEFYDIYVAEDVYVYGAGMGVGGIVGQAGGTNAVSTFKMERCWFAGTVEQASGQDYIGGLIGFTNGTGSSETAALLTTNLVDCLVTGTIIGGRYSTGGLLGQVNWGPQNINFSTSVYNGTINDSTNTHWSSAYIGGIENNKYNVLNYDKVYGVEMNYVNGEWVAMNSACGTRGFGGGSANATETDTHNFKGVTVSEIKGALAIDNTALDFSETGAWVPTVYGPQLKAFADPTTIVYDTTYTDWYLDSTSAETFYIGTAAELYSFRDLANSGVDFTGKKIMLTADIDLNEGFDAATATPATTAIKWNGINSFNATFDGDYHTISGVYYVGNNHDGSGFFNKVEAAGVVQNLQIQNSYYTDTYNGWYYGSAVGSLYGGTVHNVHVKDTRVINSYQETEADKTAGYYYGRCYGGVVGNCATNAGAVISNCSFDGEVNTKVNAGGILGRAYGVAVTIANCYNAGIVTALCDNAGGIFGQTESEVVTLSNSLNVGIASCPNIDGDNNKDATSIFGALSTTEGATVEGDIVPTDVYTTSNDASVQEGITYISADDLVTNASTIAATLGSAWTVDETTGLPALIFKPVTE